MSVEILSLISRFPGNRRRRKAIEAKIAALPYHVVFRTGWETGFAKWYCFDNLISVPKSRTIQLNALLKQADLNILRDDLKAITTKQADIAEEVGSELRAISRKAASLLQKPDSKKVKTLIEDIAAFEDFILPSVRVWENLNREMARRCELLTHPEFLYRAAAILFWTDGEDPELAVSPDHLETKVKLFKKKEVLLPLLRTPIAAILYHVDQSREDLVISLRNDLNNQAPFLKYGDEIIQLIKTRSRTPSSDSESISEKPKSTSSDQSGATIPLSEDGSEDLKALFSNMLKDSK